MRVVDRNQVEQMLSKDDAEWNLLAAILDAHPQEILHSPPSPPWTSRDVYAHLARWLDHSNEDLVAYCAGRPVSPPIADFEGVNSKWQKEDSNLSLATAKLKACASFDKRRAIIDSIPLDRWDDRLERIARYDGSDHLALHRRYVRRELRGGGRFE